MDGWPVFPPEKLLEDRESSIVIATHSGYESIQKNLKELGIDSNRVFLLSPYLFKEQEDKYFNPNFMTFNPEGEVLVDCGSCDLANAIQMSKHCDVSYVYAFEPDPENAQVCRTRAEQYFKGRAEIIEKGSWSQTTTLSFSAPSDVEGVYIRVEEDGSNSVAVTTIDEVVNENRKVTYIKMDIEGSELEALKGAQHTIRRDHPKLGICIYHKPEDMTELPMYIMSLYPGYHLYLRHHSNGEGETVLYAMP